jgi:hypothetical protein
MPIWVIVVGTVLVAIAVGYVWVAKRMPSIDYHDGH